jgi:hypothetical protein
MLSFLNSSMVLSDADIVCMKVLVFKNGRGYARVYPMKHPLPRKRTHGESFNSAIDVVERVLQRD